MPPDTHHTQPDIQDQQALPAEVLEDVVSYLTRGLDVLDMTIAAEMKWLGQLDSHKLSDVPLDVSSSFCHFVDMAVMVLESNGFTSSALGYRSHSTEFQEKLKEFRHKTNESYLKILEDAKEALLAASLDASVKNNITQSKVAIGSTRAKVLRNGNALFIHSSWYPVVSLPSSSLAWRMDGGGQPRRLPAYKGTQNDKADWVTLAVRCVLQIHKGNEGGDILVFLPGRKELEDAIKQIHASNLDTSRYGELIAFPLYKKLSEDKQTLTLEPLDPPQPFGALPATNRMRYRRKVIIATDVAALSLSHRVTGIFFVVDSGRIKQPHFDPIYSATFLQPEAISKRIPAARQDCAGRVRRGVFYYLYSKQDFENLPDIVEEHFETSRFTDHLANGYRIGMSFQQVLATHMVETSSAVVIHAIRELQSIGYLDDNEELTDYGRTLNRYPRIDPRHAHFLEICLKHRCFNDGAKLVGMLSANFTFDDVPLKRREGTDINGATSIIIAATISPF